MKRTPDERRKKKKNTASLKRFGDHRYLLIEKDICDRWNVSVMLTCVYLRLSSGDLFIFSARISCFFSDVYINWILLILTILTKTMREITLLRMSYRWKASFYNVAVVVDVQHLTLKSWTGFISSTFKYLAFAPSYC